jgi:hypothetical protein
MKRDSFFMLFGLTEDERSPKGLLLLFGVFIGSAIVGAILSPFLYTLVALLANGAGREQSFWGYLLDHEFPDFFDRARMLAVVVALIWLMRYCRLWSWSALGFRSAHLKYVPKWFVYGLLMIVLAAGVQWLVGNPVLSDRATLGKIIEKILIMTFSGLFLAIIEESIFRGMVFRIFYTWCNHYVAVVLASLFFAYVHFKHVPWQGQETHSILDGFHVAGLTLLSPFYTFDFFPFVNLFLAGLILNMIFLRTKSLWCCVGMHAGWVALKVPYGKFVHMGDGFPTFWWGTNNVIDGVMPVLMLFIVFLLVTKAKRLEA